MRIDTFRLETLGAFSGAHHYLDSMAGAIPGEHQQAIRRVREEAERDRWEWQELDLAEQDLEGVFSYHLPRVMARSFVIYLHSLVEHHLNRVADSARRRGHLSLALKEIHGPPIDRALTYLSKVAGLKVAAVPEWEELRHIATVRHTLVHRGGEIGRDSNARRLLKDLASRVVGLSSSDGWDDPDSELIFGQEFCLWATASAYRFFFVMLDLVGHSGSPATLPSWAART